VVTGEVAAAREVTAVGAVLVEGWEAAAVMVGLAVAGIR
jgi:hypothetical protein